MIATRQDSSHDGGTLPYRRVGWVVGCVLMVMSAVMGLGGCGTPQGVPGTTPTAERAGQPRQANATYGDPPRGSGASPARDGQADRAGAANVGAANGAATPNALTVAGAMVTAPFRAIGRAMGGEPGGESATGGAPTDAQAYTLRLQIFTGQGHARRAQRYASGIASDGFPDVFTVDQGEQTIVCHGRYAAPRSLPNNRQEMPRAMLADLQRLVAKYRANSEADDLTSTAANRTKIRGDYVPLPVACPANPCQITLATGEWTLCCMTVYGHPNSKLMAQQIAGEIRERLRLAAFVVPDEHQYLICVGDLPEAAVRQEAVAVSRSVTPVAALRPRRLANGVEKMYLSRDGEAPELPHVGHPVSEEAKAIWRDFRIFVANGQPVPLPGHFRRAVDPVTGRPKLDPATGQPITIHVESLWLRISYLKQARQGDTDDWAIFEGRN